MKHTRLLEIIREEIAGALNEIEKGNIKLSKGTPPTSIKQYTDKGFDVEIELEEDLLNEEPDFMGAGGQFDKKVAAKYGEEDTLEAATEKVTNRVLSDKGITKADVAKMDKKELDSLLKDIRAFISQKKQTPEVAAALKKQIEFDDSGSKLQDNQTNKAILRVLGFGSKKGPKAKESKTDAGTDDEGNEIEIDTKIQTPTGDTDIESRLNSVISAKKTKLKAAKKGSLEFKKELAALTSFLQGSEISKYIKKKIVGGKETNNPNPYSISNILKDIE